MAQRMIRARMRRTIAQARVVLELTRDEVYHLPAAYWARLPDDAYELVGYDAESRTSRLEAAALAPARRRG